MYRVKNKIKKRAKNQKTWISFLCTSAYRGHFGKVTNARVNFGRRFLAMSVLSKTMKKRTSKTHPDWSVGSVRLIVVIVIVIVIDSNSNSNTLISNQVDWSIRLIVVIVIDSNSNSNTLIYLRPS